MFEHPQNKPLSVDELLHSVRKLRDQDVDGFRRLLDEMARDANLGLSEEVSTLARTLGYSELELLEAVDGFGLVRAFGFLRHEAKQRSTGTARPLVM